MTKNSDARKSGTDDCSQAKATGTWRDRYQSLVRELHNCRSMPYGREHRHATTIDYLFELAEGAVTMLKFLLALKDADKPLADDDKETLS